MNQYSALSGAKASTPVHDDDGNLTEFKDKKYSWNAENQLISAESGNKKTTFLYDYMGQRVRKQVFSRNADNTGWNIAPDTEKLFVYDGWNLVKEITKAGASSSDKFYVWGLDLSQSLQGAGGIGGLLCAVHGGEVRHFFYDGNGNVGQVVNETGSIAAHYEYDPFGNIVNGVSPADSNPFRFSTKYYDAETGLYYYGFRYYSAELGRWWSRDPIGEKGGFNLLCFVLNNPVIFLDPNGYKGLSVYIYEFHNFIDESADNWWNKAKVDAQNDKYLHWAYDVSEAGLQTILAVLIPENDCEMFFALITIDTGPAIFKGLSYIRLRTNNIFYKISKKGVEEVAEKATEKTLSKMPTKKLYHKGELNNPKKPYLSTGTDKASVEALDRSGVVHEFEIPIDDLLELERRGLVRTLRDLDQFTGVINEELRFNRSIVKGIIEKYQTGK